jgi:hypothetical protein
VDVFFAVPVTVVLLTVLAKSQAVARPPDARPTDAGPNLRPNREQANAMRKVL